MFKNQLMAMARPRAARGFYTQRTNLLGWL
jgi:hypothetical protein